MQLYLLHDRKLIEWYQPNRDRGGPERTDVGKKELKG